MIIWYSVLKRRKAGVVPYKDLCRKIEKRSHLFFENRVRSFTDVKLEILFTM